MTDPEALRKIRPLVKFKQDLEVCSRLKDIDNNFWMLGPAACRGSAGGGGGGTGYDHLAILLDNATALSGTANSQMSFQGPGSSSNGDIAIGATPDTSIALASGYVYRCELVVGNHSRSSTTDAHIMRWYDIGNTTYFGSRGAAYRHSVLYHGGVLHVLGFIDTSGGATTVTVATETACAGSTTCQGYAFIERVTA